MAVSFPSNILLTFHAQRASRHEACSISASRKSRILSGEPCPGGGLSLQSPVDVWHILAGPKGSGKSTLLGILVFLMKPAMGRWCSRNSGQLAEQSARQSTQTSHAAPSAFVFVLRHRGGECRFWAQGPGMAKENVQRAVGESLAMVGLDRPLIERMQASIRWRSPPRCPWLERLAVPAGGVAAG